MKTRKVQIINQLMKKMVMVMELVTGRKELATVSGLTLFLKQIAITKYETFFRC